MSLRFVDSPTARILPIRIRPIRAIVVHTTGDTDITGILRYYQSSDGLQPHYCIELNGLIHRIVAEDHVAYHCKIEDAEAGIYSAGYREWSRYVWHSDQPVDTGAELSNYRQWKSTWQTQSLQSPLDLVTGRHPNSVSIGIELQQPEDTTVDVFTDAQYEALSELCADIGQRNTLRLERSCLLGHYDCSPMRRSNPSGATDPGRDFSWHRLFDMLQELRPIS